MSKFENKLIDIYSTSRIVFWHDEEGQFQFDFKTINIKNCVKHRLGQQDFKLRNEIYSKHPETKYLIYHAGPMPPDEENYLLDIILSCKVFKADRISELLEEFDLSDSFRPLLTTYKSFFKSKERIQKFKKLSNQIDGEDAFISTMLAAVLRVSIEDFDIVIQGLISGYLQDNRWNDLNKLQLAPMYLNILSTYLNYDQFSEQASENTKNIFINYENKNFKVFLDRWRRDLNYQHYYDTISVEIFDKVISPDITKHTPYIEKTDLFKQIEYSWLVKSLTQLNEGLDYNKTLELINSRKESYWYSRYESAYSTIAAACNFFIAISDFTLQTDFNIIVQNYANGDYLIDSYYRQYYFYKLKANLQNLDFSKVDNKMDSFYETDFLLKINVAFTNAIENNTSLLKTAIDQPHFYKSHVEPLLENKNKVAVIISDALRYEIGREFVDLINSENRFTAEISHGICSVPSFTQIGMASLLPHKVLQLDTKAQCHVDGISTATLSNREKILKKSHDNTRCFEVREFRDLNTSTVREKLSDISLVYIYSNVVDNTGDKRLTEKDTFLSVNNEMENLVSVSKQLASANFTNIIITADHGFIYRSKAIDEGQKIMESKTKEALHKNRRFLITDSAIDDNRLIEVPRKELPYVSKGNLVFPRALNVFKVSGAGMQFLHGGLSLQELIIPYIKIRKERKKEFDINKVDIELLSLPKRISGYHAIVNLLQRDPVEDKVLPRICKIGFYAQDESSLSNQVEIEFNYTDDEIRNREIKEVFDLSSNVINYHGTKILFIIYEKDKKFNHYSIYYKKEIQVFISEEKDFDI